MSDVSVSINQAKGVYSPTFSIPAPTDSLVFFTPLETEVIFSTPLNRGYSAGISIFSKKGSLTATSILTSTLSVSAVSKKSSVSATIT